MTTFGRISGWCPYMSKPLPTYRHMTMYRHPCMYQNLFLSDYLKPRCEIFTAGKKEDLFGWVTPTSIYQIRHITSHDYFSIF